MVTIISLELLSPITQHDPDCQDADLDGDGDVDQSDFGIFQRCISGSEQMLDLRANTENRHLVI